MAKFLLEYQEQGDGTYRPNGWWQIEGDKLVNCVGGYHDYTPAEDDVISEVDSFDDLAQEKEPCEFCGSHDIGDKRLFPKIGYQFYAGYSKQEDVDEFDEEEVEDINFCPMCGRPLKGEGNGTTD